MLDRKWCNSARGMIASVIGTGSYTSILVCSPFYSNSTTTAVYIGISCSRSTISKKDQKTRTLPSSYSFSILSVVFSIAPIFSILFYLPDSSLLFFLATLEHVLLSYSSRFQFFVFTIHQRWSSTRGEIRGLSTPQKKNKKHRITPNTVDETPTTLI